MTDQEFHELVQENARLLAGLNALTERVERLEAEVLPYELDAPTEVKAVTGYVGTA